MRSANLRQAKMYRISSKDFSLSYVLMSRTRSLSISMSTTISPVRLILLSNSLTCIINLRKSESPTSGRVGSKLVEFPGVAKSSNANAPPPFACLVLLSEAPEGNRRIRSGCHKTVKSPAWFIPRPVYQERYKKVPLIYQDSFWAFRKATLKNILESFPHRRQTSDNTLFYRAFAHALGIGDLQYAHALQITGVKSASLIFGQGV